MSEHQREMEFLRYIIRHDDSDERSKLEKSISQVQKDQHCIKRVTSVAALFPALAVATFAYGTILNENFSYLESQFAVRVLCDLGLASLICLATFAGLLTVYRMKLNRLRENYRQLAKRLLESHPDEPHIATLPGIRIYPEPIGDEQTSSTRASGIELTQTE